MSRLGKKKLRGRYSPGVCKKVPSKTRRRQRVLTLRPSFEARACVEESQSGSALYESSLT